MNYPKKARTGGNFPIGSTNPRRVIIVALGVWLGGVAAFAAEPGAAVFEKHCIPCHGPDGRARTPAGRKLGAKDLAESRLGDAEIAKQVRDGVKDARGADRMPSFREKVTAAEIDALIAYVKTFRRQK
jgi:mono/diheme cytochrome c family protein